jgi:hypothetical protein
MKRINPMTSSPILRWTHLLLTFSGLGLGFIHHHSLADEERDRVEWLSDQMRKARDIKPGMSTEELERWFDPEPGLVTVLTEENSTGTKPKGLSRLAFTYRLKRYGLIKIDVQFNDQLRASNKDRAGLKITWVSKPYLEPDINDG